MRRIVLIGTGNIARHLFNAIEAVNSFEIVQVAGRNNKALEYFQSRTRVTTDFDLLEDAEIYIMAVSDDSISGLGAILKYLDGLLVHTSGSVSLKELNDITRRGVFYPLQTFTKDIAIDFKEVPICIEAENENDYALLEMLGESLSEKVYRISSQERRQLHLSAVFVNNFVNHLYTIGHDICMEHGLSFDMLKPLIKETARKIEATAPFDAQTGPAKRQDNKTMELQMESLNKESHRKIYSAISQSILSTYGEKL